MKRICRLLPALLAPLFLLAACKPEPPETASSAVSEALPEITDPTFVSVNIETLLTAEEVSGVVGETVTGPEVYHMDASMIRFTEEDGSHYIDVMVADAGRTEFDAMKEGYDDLTEVPSLGGGRILERGRGDAGGLSRALYAGDCGRISGQK